MLFRTDRMRAVLSCTALIVGAGGISAGTALNAQPMGGDQVAMPQGAAMDRRPTAPALDEVGYAGVLASDRDGAVLAMHHSLPVPSYAEVTSLATGRTIVVRIAAQGGFDKGRVIDLSCGAISQLGLSTMPAPIRIRRITPPEQEQSVLNAGRPVAERLPSPPGLLAALRKKLPPAPRGVADRDCALAPVAVSAGADAGELPLSPSKPSKRAPTPRPPKPVPQPPVVPERVAPSPPPPAPVAKGTGFAIQIAALSNRAKANALARSLGGYVETAGGISRVRKGPYPTETAARAALPQIRAKGFADARVITNEGR